MQGAYFTNHYQTSPANGAYPIENYLDDIKNGRYQDQVSLVRTAADPSEKRKHKANLPCMMVSGQFKSNKVDGFISHSGLIVIDIDGLDETTLGTTKEALKKDTYIHALFVSAGGFGLCGLVKVPSTRTIEQHGLAFAHMSEYFFERHGVIIDYAGKNINRLRAASYDPHLWRNFDSKVFLGMAEPPAKAIPKDPPIYGNSDIEELFKSIRDRSINLCGNYQSWIDVGFAIASEFGEAGLVYFDMCSSIDAKYNSKTTETKYKSLCKAAQGGKSIGLGTLFYLAKQAGIEPVSKRTKTIAAITQNARRQGTNKEDVIKRLQVLDIPDPDGIVDKAYDTVTPIHIDLTVDEQIKMYLQSKYTIKYNCIINKVEIDGKEETDRIRNTLILECRSEISEKITGVQVHTILDSEFVASVNPLFDYANNVASRFKPDPSEVHGFLPLTYAICKAINPQASQPIDTYVYPFMAKWFVGIAASIFGKHNAIMPVLIGGQLIFKTEFVRQLFPDYIHQHYFAQMQIGTGQDKDKPVLMCQKLVILIDELEGIRNKEASHLKALLSLDRNNTRLPYGRSYVQLTRLASLIGTTNEHDIITDKTGNRRTIPILFSGVDRAAYYAIDKEALMAEWVWAFRNGFQYWMEVEDMVKLNKVDIDYRSVCAEEEALLTYVEKGGTYYSASQILTHLQGITLNNRLSLRALTQALKSNGYDQNKSRPKGSSVVMYKVSLQMTTSAPDEDQTYDPIADKDMPF